MSQRVARNYGTIGIVALAAAVIVLYSLWGASVLNTDRERASIGTPAEQLALK